MPRPLPRPRPHPRPCPWPRPWSRDWPRAWSCPCHYPWHCPWPPPQLPHQLHRISRPHQLHSSASLISRPSSCVASAARRIIHSHRLPPQPPHQPPPHQLSARIIRRISGRTSHCTIHLSRPPQPPTVASRISHRHIHPSSSIVSAAQETKRMSVGSAPR